MGTSLEGSTEDILEVVAELHRVPFEMGLPRVYSVLKLDERRDKEQTLGRQGPLGGEAPPGPPGPDRWRTS